MYCDNTGFITIANESGITKGATRYRAKVHYLREVIEFGDIKLEKVHTYDSLADPFTKALPFPKRSEHTKNIGMFPASSLNEWLLHEECGVRAGTGTDFDRRKNRALKELVDHVGNKKGYYATRTFYYPQVNVLGQCEGDLGVDDCVNCVKTAIDFDQADCGSAFNGDVYLQKCYISYSDGGDNNGGNTGGLVALVVAAVVFMLLQS
ncbi:retrovirus-related pol polyprotein from transposon TNT 1-94 [Tanacetum coccineum]